MKQKLAGLLLLCTLCQLCACGDTEGPKGTDTAADSSQPTDTTEAVTEGEYVAPAVDYNNEAFPIVVLKDWPSGWRLSEYHMLSEEEDSDKLNDAIVRANRAVEELLHVDLQLSGLQYDQPHLIDKMTTSIHAGDDEFKFATITTVGMPAFLAEPTMLCDLAEIETLDLSHSWWNQNSVEEYTLFGHSYAASGDICLYSNGAPVCYFFNKKLAADLDLGNFYELVDAGTWTLDTMIGLAKEAQSDELNGNQKVDIGDRFGLISEPHLLTQSIFSAGGRYSQKTENGISLVINNEKTVSIIDKMSAVLQDSALTLSEVGRYDGEVYKDIYNVYMPVFVENRALFFSNQLLVAFDLRAMEADYGILPTPKYDEAQEQYYTSLNTWWSSNVVVPTTNEELERTGHVLDAMGYYAKQYVTPAFIDDTVLSKGVRDGESARMVRLILDTQVYDICQIFNWGGLLDKVFALPGNEATSFSSMYASAESAVEKAIEATVEALSE